MPLTTLDPSTALIVIDLQKGIVNGNFIHPIGEVIDRTRALNRCFPCEEPPSRAGQCGGTGAGPDGTGSAQQHIVFGGVDRPSTAAGSATERYCRHQAKLGRIRNNGS